jgi:hypothetical protein
MAISSDASGFSSLQGRDRLVRSLCASNSKFKGHSTGNGWFIAHPHPELEVPGQ